MLDNRAACGFLFLAAFFGMGTTCAEEEALLKYGWWEHSTTYHVSVLSDDGLRFVERPDEFSSECLSTPEDAQISGAFVINESCQINMTEPVDLKAALTGTCVMPDGSAISIEGTVTISPSLDSMVYEMSGNLVTEFETIMVSSRRWSRLVGTCEEHYTAPKFNLKLK